MHIPQQPESEPGEPLPEHDPGDAPPEGHRRGIAPEPKAQRRWRLSDILTRLAEDTTRERVSVGDIVAAMPGRATAALLFLFAAPNAIPTPPGTSALLGLPMVYLASQMMLRRQPWLPKLVAARSMRIEDFAALVGRAVPVLARAERMLRPRLLPLVSPAAEVLIGAFCFLLALVVALPIPLGNMLPGFAVAILALGVLERDGVWVIVGTMLGLTSLLVVGGVVWAMIAALVFMIGQAWG
ncbi:exopolysaccharide biosynthesis protein [Paracoccus sp. S-4012]|nr:exopolysaccharide biosynthesis protein [Paracoccus sp. S-4012]